MTLFSMGYGVVAVGLVVLGGASGLRGGVVITYHWMAEEKSDKLESPALVPTKDPKDNS